MNSTAPELGEEATVAFVGVAKNAGKTTALNRMVEDLDRAGRRAGLVSIGVDGESTDAILGVDKPAIYLPEGHRLAAGADALSRCSARFEYLHSLDFSTAFGRAYVVRVTDPGEVVVGGLRHREDLRRARSAILETGGGVDRVLVDGAYGRTVAADGRIADGVVLATGAIVGETPAEIVERTAMYVEAISLEAPGAEGAELAREALVSGRLLFEGDGRREALTSKSVLRGLRRRRGAWPEAVERVAVPGALTDSIAEEFLHSGGRGRSLIVTAPASVQTSHRVWRSLVEGDWDLRALHPVDLLGIAANPFDPRGGDVDRDALLGVLRSAWPGVVVYDATACNAVALG